MKKKYLAAVLLVMAMAGWAQSTTHKWKGTSFWDKDGTGKYAFSFGSTKGGGNYKTNTTPDDEQIIFLYNRGAKKFFNCGGHWGVEGKLHEVGMPVYLSWMGTGNGSTCQYLIKKGPIYDDTATEYYQNYVAYIWDTKVHLDERGVITDRRRNNSVYQEIVPAGEEPLSLNTVWSLEETATADADGRKRTYYIYTEGADGKRYYLCKNGGGGLRDEIVTAKQVAGNNPGALYNVEEYRWMLVSKREMKADFTKTTASYVDMSDATFFIYDQNFSRNNGNEAEWKFVPESSGTVFDISNKEYGNGDDKEYHTVWYGEEQYTTHVPGEKTAYNLLYGEFYNAELRSGNGKVYQTVRDLGITGYYLLSVQGFYRPGEGSDMKGYVYAKSTSNTGENQDGWTKTYLPHINSENVPVPADLTQSGIAFNADKKAYSVNIMVWVDKAADDLEIGFGMENSSSPDDWVAVDNVQLRYVGADYLISEHFQSTYYYPNGIQNYTVLNLEREFQLGQWNSLTLPVDLNKEQVKTAFGTDVKLATLQGLSADGITIEFKTVDLNAKKYTDIVIGKNQFYLIKTNAAPRTYQMGWGKQYPNPDPVTRNYPFYLIPGVYFNPSAVGDHSENYLNAKGQGVTVKNTNYYHQSETEKIPASESTYVYVMNKGSLTRYTKPFKLKGLRWYIIYSDAPGGAKVFVDGDNETTGIPTLDAEASTQKVRGVYTPDGKRVSDRNCTEGLPTGLYIVDGKKEWVY